MKIRNMIKKQIRNMKVKRQIRQIRNMKRDPLGAILLAVLAGFTAVVTALNAHLFF